jgi:hypothetical protein
LFPEDVKFTHHTFVRTTFWHRQQHQQNKVKSDKYVIVCNRYEKSQANHHNTNYIYFLFSEFLQRKFAKVLLLAS